MIEKWEPVLRQFPAFKKTLRVLFFETPEGQRGYVIDECIPGSRSFPETKLPQGANETEAIVTKNYPRRDLYEKLKITLPHEQTTWLANQIRRIGQGKHGGRLNNEELQECALSLEETIKKYVPRGRRCIREIGELLQAAFPNDFQPKDDLSKATVKLIKRAHKRGVVVLEPHDTATV